MNPTLAAMVKLQWRTAMRPGEVAGMRLRDLDMTGDVWVYRPRRHKTAWRGKTRQISIGPEGQEILKPFLTKKLDALVFTDANGRPISNQAYRRAITKAADAAGVKPWRPNQLRHTRATEIRERFGAQAVQDVLGHANLNQQQVYVDQALERAKRIAREVG